MKIKTRELTLCAVLAALALALSYMESFFPLALIVPLPGVKLGLANIVTLYALYALGFPSALAILLVRCTLGALFAGNASALLFSLLGGLSALLVMALLSGAKKLSIFGVSIAGASAPRSSRSARPRRSTICRFCCWCRSSRARSAA